MSKYCKGVLLTASKNQSKIQSRSEDNVRGAGTKNEGLKNICHEHEDGSRYKEIYFQVPGVVMLLYVVLYDTLLQNSTAILLQNATKVHCKIRQLL